MVGVERIAEAQAWVDAHGRSLAPDALAGELLERFPLLAPQDYAALLERTAGVEAKEVTPEMHRDANGNLMPDGQRAADPTVTTGQARSASLPVAAPIQETDPVARAQELIVFCDGLEEAGELDRYVSRARMVARDVVELVAEAEAERSARVAAFAERDRWQAVALSYSRRAQGEDDEEPGPDGAL